MFEGRLNRWAFWWKAQLRLIIMALVGYGIVRIVDREKLGDSTAALIVLGFILLTFLVELDHMVRRLHDLNMSGGYLILMLVPFVDIWLANIMTFRKGTAGPNDYGPDPLEVGRENISIESVAFGRPES